MSATFTKYGELVEIAVTCESEHDRTCKTLLTISALMDLVGQLEQPMDTAPRDGTRVLARDGHEWQKVFWGNAYGEGKNAPCYLTWCIDGTFDEEGYTITISPLCWLPMPGKPEGA